MGLYDDDAADAQASDEYRAASSAAAAMRSGSGDVGALLDALARAIGKFPVLDDGDDDVKTWRREAKTAALALRSGSAEKWKAIAARHPAFAEALDLPEGWVRFEKRDGRFVVAFALPANWRREERDNEISVRPADQSDEAFFVTTRALNASYSMESFAAWSVEELRREIPRCEIGARRFVKLGALDAYEIEVSWSDLRAIEVFAMCGNSAVTAGIRARASEQAKFLAAGREILATVRVAIL